MRYRDGRRSICVSSQSGCPLTCTFCATGAMKFGRNLQRLRDPRPGAALPAARAGEPSRLHGDGRAVSQLRRGARGGAAAPGRRDHAPPHDDLDRRLDARPAAVRRRGRAADPARALDPRRRPAAALGADAGERPLPAPRGAGRVPPLLRAPAAEGLRRVRDARRRQRLARARARARQAARSEGLQGEPDPVQPDRVLRRLVAARRSPRSRTCSTAPASRRRCGSPAAATSRRPAASSPRRASRSASRASPGAGRSAPPGRHSSEWYSPGDVAASSAATRSAIRCASSGGTPSRSATCSVVWTA